ncbi:hypothetical protein K8Z61_13310 [Nocardioides sp. TRM66260-LWL]|uniref:hypothetical protein n=1 Tax=Nocardioides sp. TRM66260-LWL TaxID=2874478 RepID=UPI001CC6E60B|nr:hypothetical protein [Nocardioides sp. TRM66260-LWL]MBZ5735473.1 hypothetical protein [Nocardioides sp. TRM66260-LWL]
MAQPDLWLRSTTDDLRRLAEVFLDPVFVADLSAEGPRLSAPLARAAERSAALLAVLDAGDLSCADVTACLEAVDRSMLELQAATAGLDVEPWWSHAALREAVRAA